jgi:membrane protein DedA with SNARE-associated domain
MHNATEFLTQHGYAALFIAVFAEQLGLPIPATPFLIGAGALASLHQLSLPAALGLALSASLLSDSIWFYLGKRRGSSIVRLISKICRKPEACAAGMHSRQPRSGARSILFSKFVPGLNTLTPSLAGMFGVPAGRFLGLDSAAVLLWSGAYMAVGWVFRDQLERVGIILERFGALIAVLAVVALAVYSFRYWQRSRRQSVAVPSKKAFANAWRVNAGLPELPNVTAGFRAFPSEAAAWSASFPSGLPRHSARPPPNASPPAHPGSRHVRSRPAFPAGFHCWMERVLPSHPI